MRFAYLLSGLLFLGAGSVSAANAYTLDTSHTSVGFSVRHLGVSNVKGSFHQLAGTLKYDAKDVTKSVVDISIQATSINTANEKRDDHLRNADFFETAKYPTIVFKSKSVTRSPQGLLVRGDLTMKGVTKSIEFPVTLNGPIQDPWGNNRLGVEGALSIDRRGYNITYDATGVAVGHTIKIDLQAEFTSPGKK